MDFDWHKIHGMHMLYDMKKKFGGYFMKKNTFFHFFGPIGQTPEIFLSGLILFWPTKTMIKIFVSLRICILEVIFSRFSAAHY